MALKRRFKTESGFSMASMTDIIFLLLIFFMITSTLVVPNALKVMLPKSSQQSEAKSNVRIYIDSDENLSFATAQEKPRTTSIEEIEAYFQKLNDEKGETFVALYADESVPYKEIVRIMDLANRYKYKMILMTRSR